jgi:hypothetical protein
MCVNESPNDYNLSLYISYLRPTHKGREVVANLQEPIVIFKNPLLFMMNIK